MRGSNITKCSLPAAFIRAFGLLFLIMAPPLHSCFGQGTAFTIQSRLLIDNIPANGSYDMIFELYNAAQSGTVVAGPVINLAVNVSNGLFTTTVNFGSAPWNGQALWLCTSVRTNGNGPFTALANLTPITPTPYAITASNLSGTVSAGQIAGVLSNSALPASPVFSGTVTAGGGYSGNGGGLTNVTAGALTASVTNGVVSVATNIVPTRAEISSSVVILPTFDYQRPGMYLLLSADGGRTFQNPLSGFAYHFQDMSPLPDSWAQDFCVTYYPYGGNDLWLATFTAAFGYSKDAYWTNHWPLLVSSNFYDWHFKAGIPITNSITGSTNSAHCWVTQWLDIGDGLPHLLIQGGDGGLPSALYETHPVDGSLTNWSPWLFVSGDFYSNFSYDCTFFPLAPVGTPPAQVKTWAMLYKPANPETGWNVALSASPFGPYTTTPTNIFGWVPWFGWATNLTPPMPRSTAPEGPWPIHLPDGRWRIFGFYNTQSVNNGMFYSDSQDTNFLDANWVPDANAQFNFGYPPGTLGTNGGHSVGYIPGPAELSKILANLAEYRNLGLTAPGVRVPELLPGGWYANQTAQITLTSASTGLFQRNDALGAYWDLDGDALSGYRLGWNGIAGPNSQVYLLAHEGNGITLDLGLANTNAWYATTLTIHTNGPETNALWVPHGNVDLGDQLTVRGAGGITNLSLAGGTGFITVDANGREILSTNASLLSGFRSSQITAALGFTPQSNSPEAFSNLVRSIGSPSRGQFLAFDGQGLAWSNAPFGSVPPSVASGSNAVPDDRDARIRALELRLDKLELLLRQQGKWGQ